MNENGKKLLQIAQRFEDQIGMLGLKEDQVKEAKVEITISVKDLYFLLCLVMPDPQSITWGDPDVTWRDPNTKL